MTAGIRYEANPTFRDLQGRFARAEKELLAARREMVRQLGREAVDLLREESPRKAGKFAAGIRFRTFQSGETLGFTTSLPQPLGKWIVGGTRPHVITAAGPRFPLSFFWKKVGRRVFAYRVNHPGTKANPFVAKAHARWLPKAAAAMRQISTRYTAALR